MFRDLDSFYLVQLRNSWTKLLLPQSPEQVATGQEVYTRSSLQKCFNFMFSYGRFPSLMWTMNSGKLQVRTSFSSELHEIHCHELLQWSHSSFFQSDLLEPISRLLFNFFATKNTCRTITAHAVLLVTQGTLLERDFLHSF